MSGSPPPEPPPKGYADALHELNIAVAHIDRVREYLKQELKEEKKDTD